MGDLSLRLLKGGRAALTTANVSSGFAGTPAGEIVYRVTNLSGGFPERADMLGVPVLSLTEADLLSRSIRFVDDGTTRGGRFDVAAPEPGAPGEAARTVRVAEVRETSAFLDIAVLDGTEGFRLSGDFTGAFPGEAFRDNIGYSVATVGDFNADGFGDVVIGAPLDERIPAAAGEGGRAFVVFGKADGFSGVVDLAALDGADGFRFDGEQDGERLGPAVAGVGDFNGDGFDDVAFSAPSYAQTADNGSLIGTGRSFMIYGSPDPFAAAVGPADIEADVVDGVKFIMAEIFAATGRTIAAGDVNGDGLADVIFGAIGDNAYAPGSGAAYVVFGGFVTPVSLTGARAAEVEEGGATTLTAAMLGATAADAIFHVSGATGGAVTVAGGDLPGAETAFTATQLAAGLVSFRHDGGAGPVGFGVTATDAAGAVSEAGLFALSILEPPVTPPTTPPVSPPASPPPPARRADHGRRRAEGNHRPGPDRRPRRGRHAAGPAGRGRTARRPGRRQPEGRRRRLPEGRRRAGPFPLQARRRRRRDPALPARD